MKSFVILPQINNLVMTNSNPLLWNYLKNLDRDEKIELIVMLTNSLKEDSNKQDVSAKDFYGIWGDDGMSADEFVDLIRSERIFHREITEL